MKPPLVIASTIDLDMVFVFSIVSLHFFLDGHLAVFTVNCRKGASDASPRLYPFVAFVLLLTVEHDTGDGRIVVADGGSFFKDILCQSRHRNANLQSSQCFLRYTLRRRVFSR